MIAHAPLPIIADTIAALYKEAGVSRPSSKYSIAPLAELVAAFNLDCTELSGLTSQSAMSYLLRHGGLLEPFDEASGEALAGFLYTSPNFGSIFVEQGDPIARRRFSVAHELGHYLLHFRPLLESIETDSELFLIEAINARKSTEATESDELLTGRVTANGEASASYQLPDLDQMEREANQFAAELLMPAEVIDALSDRHALLLDGHDLARRLADEMLVSREAMRWRLQSLGHRSS